MAGSRTVLVHVEHLMTDDGQWCNDCSLPSGFRVWTVVRCQGRLSLQAAVMCIDCGGRNVT